MLLPPASISKCTERFKARGIKAGARKRPQSRLILNSHHHFKCRAFFPEKADSAVELEQLLNFKSRLKEETEHALAETNHVLASVQARIDATLENGTGDKHISKECRSSSKRHWIPMRKITQTIRQKFTGKRPKPRKPVPGIPETDPHDLVDHGLSEYLDLNSRGGHTIKSKKSLFRDFEDVFGSKRSLRKSSVRP